MDDPGTSRRRWRLAANDVLDGLRGYPVWSMLAYQDIHERYVRSLLGEFWISISLGIGICSIGILYGRIFRFDMADYLPYLAAGTAAWTLISSALNEGAQAFIADYRLLLQSHQPKSLYIFRVLLRAAIVYAHNLAMVLLVCAFFGIWPTVVTLAILPNVVLVLVNIGWMALILALFATRFRDVPPILGNVLQILFFMTPIIWKPDQAPQDIRFVIFLNPFTTLLELLRAPMLGTAATITTYLTCVVMAVAGWAVALMLFAKVRHRIAYWL